MSQLKYQLRRALHLQMKRKANCSGIKLPPIKSANTSSKEITRVETIKIKKPPIQPRFSSKGELQEAHSRLVNGKLSNLKRMVKEKFNKNSFDDQQMARWIFGESKVRRSTSLFDISSLADFDNKETKYSDNSSIDDDIRTLGKLSTMNMGARYELLNANQMMLNLDLELVRVLITIEQTQFG